MPERIPQPMRHARPPKQQPSLQGWRDIAAFLGQPIAVAQRWAKQGMPVRREGRYVTTTAEDLERWLGEESGTRERVHVEAAERDLAADLKRSLREARHHRGLHRVKSQICDSRQHAHSDAFISLTARKKVLSRETPRVAAVLSVVC